MGRKFSRLWKRRRSSTSSRSFNYFYNQPGSSPGTLFVAEGSDRSELKLIRYDRNHYDYCQHLKPEEVTKHIDPEAVCWFDLSGLGDRSTLEKVGQEFRLHPLVLEDVINVPQRPKIEDREEQLLIITQMVNLKPRGAGFWLEQVSFILSEDYLLTIQEEPSRDCFGMVRDRLKLGRGNIRDRGADYLTYALWDAIIDGYFPVLEVYGEKIEELEQEAIIQPSEATLKDIYQVRRELLALLRGIWSQRDALNSLIKEEHPFISDAVLPYLRDCYDHSTHIIDTIETYRELTSGLMDIYLSVVNNKMNEVMKLLTVVSSIFIPLSFIAGLYGMNFNPAVSPLNMPELSWYWGYPFCLGVMSAIAIVLLIYFWRKGWLSSSSIDKHL